MSQKGDTVPEGIRVGSGALVHGSTPRSRFDGLEKDQNQSKDQQSVKMS